MPRRRRIVPSCLPAHIADNNAYSYGVLDGDTFPHVSGMVAFAPDGGSYVGEGNITAQAAGLRQPAGRGGRGRQHPRGCCFHSPTARPPRTTRAQWRRGAQKYFTGDVPPTSAVVVAPWRATVHGRGLLRSRGSQSRNDDAAAAPVPRSTFGAVRAAFDLRCATHCGARSSACRAEVRYLPVLTTCRAVRGKSVSAYSVLTGRRGAGGQVQPDRGRAVPHAADLAGNGLGQFEEFQAAYALVRGQVHAAVVQDALGGFSVRFVAVAQLPVGLGHGQAKMRSGDGTTATSTTAGCSITTDSVRRGEPVVGGLEHVVGGRRR